MSVSESGAPAGELRPDPVVLAEFIAVAGGLSARVHDLVPLDGGAIQDNWSLSVEFAGRAGREELVLRARGRSGGFQDR